MVKAENLAFRYASYSKEKNKKVLKAYASEYNKKYYKEHKREIIDRATNYTKNNKEKHNNIRRKI